MEKEFLPADVGNRIRDLRRSKKMSQDEFADAIGICRSSVYRIEKGKSISSDELLEIAQYFNVSVEFLLGKTDYPKVINYDLKSLGLTEKAAEKLYTGKVDAGVLNLLIEHEKCGELMKLITYYLMDIMADARKAQNELYSEMGKFLRSYGDDADADAVEASTEPVYSSDISKIHYCFDTILKDTKKELNANKRDFRKEMNTTLNHLIQNVSKSNGAIRKINADKFASDVIKQIVSRIPLPRELTDNLYDALVPIFKADWRGAKK